MHYPVFKHPEQEQMQAEVILASRHADREDEKPLFTIRLRYPRIIHGEIMTHRVFSRNARSSRAVPVKTMLNEVQNSPFVPWHWGTNQGGMQAGEECYNLVEMGIALDLNEACTIAREEAWLHARDFAAETAKAYMEAGYHKQIPNRLLEPFSWIDTLITSNDWANFLWLRDHKDAEPHLQDLAQLVRDALEWTHLQNAIQKLKPGQWHLPYITEYDRKDICAYVPDSPLDYDNLLKISAARCARISYKPFDGDASYERELERYDQLVSSDRVHASPTEHQASPDEKTRFRVENKEFAFDVFDEDRWNYPEDHGNLHGWIQARKLIPNEYVSS